MKNIAYAVMAMAALSACDGVGDEESSGGVQPPVMTGDAITIGDVEAASFEGGVLTVQVALDGEDLLQEFEQSGESENGYVRFVQQASPLNRAFSAVAGESSQNREIVAVVTMDGGQFNRFLGGGNLAQGAFSAPDGGFSYYSGNYEGLVNVGPSLSVVPGAPDAVRPGVASIVTGKVYLFADFVDGKVEGTLYDREVTFDELRAILPEELVLTQADITSAGRFEAAVELDSSLTQVGSYSGAFGGPGASYAGGLVALRNGAYRGALDADPLPYPDNASEEEIDLIDAINIERQAQISAYANVPTLQEYGLFIIGQCESGSAGCFPAEP